MMARVDDGKIDWHEIEENLKHDGVTDVVSDAAEASESDFTSIRRSAVMYNNPFFGHDVADVPDDLLNEPDQQKDEPVSGSDQTRVKILQDLNKESARQPAVYQEERLTDHQVDDAENEDTENQENRSPVIRKKRRKRRRKETAFNPKTNEKEALLFHPHPTKGWIQPDLTLSMLIAMAIMSSPQKRIRVRQITSTSSIHSRTIKHVKSCGATRSVTVCHKRLVCSKSQNFHLIYTKDGNGVSTQRRSNG